MVRKSNRKKKIKIKKLKLKKLKLKKERESGINKKIIRENRKKENKLDDLKLINLLIKNARISYVSLAKKFGVSETAIRKRIKKLEKEQVIKGYTIIYDLKEFGYSIHALIGIDAKPETYTEVIEYISELKDVKAVYSSTGDHMLLIEIWFRDSRELRSFIRKLKSIKGITRVCPAILLERIK